MSVRLFSSGVVLCAFGILSVSSQSLAAQFSWDAPAGCPDRDALRWRIEEALGTSLVQAAPLHFSAKVTEKSAKRWVVALDVTRDGSEAQQRRELEAATCDELAQAVSIAIALALGADPSAEKSEATVTPPASSSEELATPKPKAATEAPLTRAAVPKEKPENRSSYWFAAELGPSFDLGSLPGLAGGVQVSVIGGWRGLGLRLGGVLFPDRSNQEVGKPGGTFTLVAASAAVCGVVERPPTRLRLCAGSELGQLSGKAENTTYSWTRSSSWAAPFVEVAGSWPLFGDSFRVFGAGAAAMPLIRRKFWVDNFGMVFQPGTIVGRLGLGLELLWR